MVSLDNLCYNEHVPVGQVPVGHDEEFVLPSSVLNAENCFLGSGEPHFGQFGACSEIRRAK